MNMSKNNAKAEALSNEQLMQLILSLKAENEALKASAPQAAISVSAKGGINVSVPSGKGSVNLHFYVWQWEKVSAMRDKVDAFVKANKGKLISEEAFRSRDK